MNTPATASSGAPPYPGSPRLTPSNIIAVMNQKGGVGKTMVVLSQAAYTAEANGRALVVDCDPQATAHDLTRTLADPGYDVVLELDPASLTRVSRLREYDSIYADCPGSLEGDKVLDEILRQATEVIIPYTHEPEDLMPTLRTARKVQDAGIPYGIVVTRADPRLGAEFVEDAWRTLDKARVRHFRSFIREYRAWPNSLTARVPITRFSERYAPRLREDASRLHAEVLMDIGRRGARVMP